MATVSSSTESSISGLKGRSISVLGDSMSTYMNVSTGTTVKTTNSTLKNYRYYYNNTRERLSVGLQDMWWYQTAATLGMRILVNNSAGGSCVYLPCFGVEGAYINRCVQLHDDTPPNAGEKPDIIAIHLGQNDVHLMPQSMGKEEEIDYDALITPTGDGHYIYKTPTSTAEAYALMIARMLWHYPDAEIYCFTQIQYKYPPAARKARKDHFNDTVRKIAEHYGVYVVDLDRNGIIYQGSPNFDHYMGPDSIHPRVPGMNVIAKTFISSILENSNYIKDTNARPGEYIQDINGVNVGATYVICTKRKKDETSSLLYCNGTVTDSVQITETGSKLTMHDWLDPTKSHWKVVRLKNGQIALKSCVPWADYYLDLSIPYPSPKARTSSRPSAIIIKKGEAPGTYNIQDGSIDYSLSYDHEHNQFSSAKNGYADDNDAYPIYGLFKIDDSVELTFYKLIEE